MASNGTFKAIDIGDHCSIIVSYSRDVEMKEIPRANGVIIRNRGGGKQDIMVNAWVIKTTRQQIEDYCRALATSFGNTVGTLIINGTTYTNCYFIDMMPNAEDKRWNIFSLRFVRNPF